MAGAPIHLHDKLQRFGQEHVLHGWDALDEKKRARLVQRVEGLELELLARLYRERDQVTKVPDISRIGAIDVIPAQLPAAALRAHAARGAEALQHGEVAALLVAGGQGSRLGISFPKGKYPVGPVSSATLFQIHAEKVMAVRRRYGKPVPFLIMTSDATHDETVAFFEEHGYFGLPSDEVFFFRQGTMPALDMATGKLLMAAPGELSLSPNGHGGTLRALADSGLLDQLQKRGIRQVFYFQVDNPLVKVADPVYLGQHLETNADVSTKVVAKLGPTERMGNVVLVDGRCSMIEYSDLPESLANARDDKGRLRFWAGSTAIHVFSVDFLQRVSGDPKALPFHIARKKVPHMGTGGAMPERENAMKFELFIFDVLPLADRWTVVETRREEEFAPLKNVSGADSEETVRRAMLQQAAAWLEGAGVKVPRRSDGEPEYSLEISPLYAIDQEELQRKVDKELRIQGPVLLR
jgi:UDP-N-acetylglucosamine/UDP-N-acetylgalactosamine diphosphorylase